MDTKNTTEIDFIGLMARYLDRVNFDPEFFLTLLLECESTKVKRYLTSLKHMRMQHLDFKVSHFHMFPYGSCDALSLAPF